MSDEVNQSQDRIWYIRIKGKVFGPLAASRIRHYINEGQIELADEASRNKTNWKYVSSEAELIPLQLRKPDAADEAENLSDQYSGKGSFWVTTVIVIVLIGGVIGAALLFHPPETSTTPDCEAKAGQGINWNNCNKRKLQAENIKMDNLMASNAIFKQASLSGASLKNANLIYVHFEEADLSYADLTGATLKGANLQGADLGNAIMDNADLRYCNFSGANMGGASLVGAQLDSAVWFNGRPCQAGSVGKCVQLPQ